MLKELRIAGNWKELFETRQLLAGSASIDVSEIDFAWYKNKLDAKLR